MKDKRYIFVLLFSASFLLLCPAMGSGMGLVPADSGAITVDIRLKNGGSVVNLLRALGMKMREAKTTDPAAELAQKILTWFTQQGYYFATIDTLEKRATPAQRWFIFIDTGVRFADMHVRPGSMPQNLQKAWRKRFSDTIPINHLVTELPEFLADFAENGYPFAQLVFDSLRLARLNSWETEISAGLLIEPGPLIRLDSIGISGNTLTKERVIRRQLGLKKGDIYRASRIKTAQDNLNRLGIFSTVGKPQLFYENEKALLQIDVREGNTNAFNGVAGYNPGSDGRSGYLTGIIDLRFGNLLGSGRQISARWEKRNRDAQELALHYREPWIFKLPLHVSGGFEQLIQDTLYVERRFNLEADLPLRRILHFTGRLWRKSINPDLAGQTIFNIEKSTAIAAGFGLQVDTMDDQYNPRRGVFYATMIESVRKDAVSRFRQQKLSVDVRWALPLRRFQVFHAAMHWRHITSDEIRIDFADQYRLGGARSLRGYREEQFRGQRIAWLNLEYRYLLASRSRAFIFYDAGYVYQKKTTGIFEQTLGSVGLGVRMETRLGIVGLDYGLGRGDGLSQGKVHVRLTNSF